MEKIFHSYLKNYMFLTNEKLQDEQLAFIREDEIVINSNIYFVTKIKKLRFDISSLKIGFNYNLKGEFFVGRKRIPFDYSLLDIYFSIPQIKEHFKSKAAFVNYYYTCNLWPSFINELCMKYKFRKEFAFNDTLSDTDGKYIYLNSGLTKKLTRENDLLPLYADNLVGLLEVNNLLKIDNFAGELIYIGKSKDITKRTSKHNKFSKFYSQLKDDEELLFYFLEFDDSSLSIDRYEQLNNFTVITNIEVNEITKDNRISLIEACLINYFKPIVNVQEKNSNISHSVKVEEHLKKNDFTKIHIEFITEGALSRFGNNIVPHSNIHNINYDLLKK